MRKAESLHLAKVAGLGCIVCFLQGNEGTPAEIHHPRDNCGMAQRASHYEAIPLCPAHHRLGDGTDAFNGQWGFHKNQREFESRYGDESELLARVRREIGWEM